MATEGAPARPPLKGIDTRVTTLPSTRVDRAIGPTAEEARAANAGEYTPRGANRFLYNISKNWAVRLGLMGAAGVAAYQNVPAVHEFVDSKLFHTGESASNPDVFDPQQEIIDLTRRNTTAISRKEVGEATKINLPDPAALETFIIDNPDLPRYISREPVLQIPLPFEIPENSRILLRYLESNKGFGVSNIGVKDSITVNGLPKDTVVYAPISGRFFISQTGNASGISTLANIVSIDSKGNRYGIGFRFGVSESLIDADVTTENGPGGVTTWRQEIDVEAGQPLFMLDVKDTPGNWLPDQLMMEGSVSLVNPDNPNLPKKVYSPLVIQTEENKAVSVKT